MTKEQQGRSAGRSRWGIALAVAIGVAALALHLAAGAGAALLAWQGFWPVALGIVAVLVAHGLDRLRRYRRRRRRVEAAPRG